MTWRRRVFWGMAGVATYGAIMADAQSGYENGLGPLDLKAPECMLGNVGRVLIEEALRMTEGNVSEAARRLGIGRGAIRRKMEHLNLSAQAIVYPDRQSRE